MRFFHLRTEYSCVCLLEMQIDKERHEVERGWSDGGREARGACMSAGGWEDVDFVGGGLIV